MDQRNGVRHRIGILAALMTPENRFICFGAVENVSAGGAKLKLTKEAELPGTFVIVLSSKDGPRRNCLKVWQDAHRVGLRFLPMNEAEQRNTGVDKSPADEATSAAVRAEG